MMKVKGIIISALAVGDIMVFQKYAGTVHRFPKSCHTIFKNVCVLEISRLYPSK